MALEKKLSGPGVWGMNYHRTVLAPFDSFHNHTDGNGNSIHSVKWICVLEQYANNGTEAPSLGLLHFPHSSLNSCLTYGQYHTTYCLVIWCSVVWASQQVGSSRCNRDHCYIYHVTPTMPFTGVAVLVCIHSSIHSTMYTASPLCARIHSAYMLRVWTVQGLYSCRAYIWMRWDGKQRRKTPQVTNMIERLKIG